MLQLHPMIKMTNSDKHSERIRNFLESGTPKAKITKVTLCILALASMPALVFFAAATGNAVQVFGKFKTSRRFTQEQIRDSVKYLKQQKLIEYVADKRDRTIVKITKKGKSKLREFDIELIKIKKPKKWDRKWRLVIYDLPLRFKKAREELRWKLKQLSFFQFQKSAWVFPYPCEDEIIYITDFYGIRNYIDILIAESVLNDGKLKKHFSLN